LAGQGFIGETFSSLVYLLIKLDSRAHP